ncbi:transposase, partial [Actinomadura sp. HBU206391]|uniref:IS701 family transposase n=1 Tax=Actinomadura sp. HBU206391 TaxID=2731692 RepID=UPI00164EF2AB
MIAEELGAVRVCLEDFAAEMFAPLVRRDQRINGGLYLRGLMLDGRRKSMQPMAERLGVDHQRLQQFITSSTWDYVAVRRRLAVKTAEVVAAGAWVLDDTGHLKDGDASPCVARQYTGTAGKVTNCQIAVSVHAVTDACSAPLDWRLFLPERWDDALAADPAEAKRVAARRVRAGIPDEQRHR